MQQEQQTDPKKKSKPNRSRKARRASRLVHKSVLRENMKWVVRYIVYGWIDAAVAMRGRSREASVSAEGKQIVEQVQSIGALAEAQEKGPCEL